MTQLDAHFNRFRRDTNQRCLSWHKHTNTQNQRPSCRPEGYDRQSSTTRSRSAYLRAPAAALHRRRRALDVLRQHPRLISTKLEEGVGATDVDVRRSGDGLYDADSSGASSRRSVPFFGLFVVQFSDLLQLNDFAFERRTGILKRPSQQPMFLETMQRHEIQKRRRSLRSLAHSVDRYYDK